MTHQNVVYASWKKNPQICNLTKLAKAAFDGSNTQMSDLRMTPTQNYDIFVKKEGKFKKFTNTGCAKSQ